MSVCQNKDKLRQLCMCPSDLIYFVHLSPRCPQSLMPLFDLRVFVQAVSQVCLLYQSAENILTIFGFPVLASSGAGFRSNCRGFKSDWWGPFRITSFFSGPPMVKNVALWGCCTVLNAICLGKTKRVSSRHSEFRTPLPSRQTTIETWNNFLKEKGNNHTYIFINPNTRLLLFLLIIITRLYPLHQSCDEQHNLTNVIEFGAF